MATKQKAAAVKKKTVAAKVPAARPKRAQPRATAKAKTSAAAQNNSRVIWMAVSFTSLSLVYLAVIIWRRG